MKNFATCLFIILSINMFLSQRSPTSVNKQNSTDDSNAICKDYQDAVNLSKHLKETVEKLEKLMEKHSNYTSERQMNLTDINNTYSQYPVNKTISYKKYLNTINEKYQSGYYQQKLQKLHIALDYKRFSNATREKCQSNSDNIRNNQNTNTNPNLKPETTVVDTPTGGQEIPVAGSTNSTTQEELKPETTVVDTPTGGQEIPVAGSTNSPTQEGLNVNQLEINNKKKTGYTNSKTSEDYTNSKHVSFLENKNRKTNLRKNVQTINLKDLHFVYSQLLEKSKKLLI